MGYFEVRLRLTKDSFFTLKLKGVLLTETNCNKDTESHGEETSTLANKEELQ